MQLYRIEVIKEMLSCTFRNYSFNKKESFSSFCCPLNFLSLMIILCKVMQRLHDGGRVPYKVSKVMTVLKNDLSCLKERV